LSVPVNSDFPLIRLALPGVEHGLIGRRHGRRDCVETTVSITVSHISSLPSLAVPDNCLLGGGVEPVWWTQGRLWDLGWTGALFLTEICCTRAETVGPIWSQGVGPVDPTRLIRPDGSGLISTNGSGTAARPSEKRKVAASQSSHLEKRDRGDLKSSTDTVLILTDCSGVSDASGPVVGMLKRPPDVRRRRGLLKLLFAMLGTDLGTERGATDANK
jgi:hypothetical protein